MKGGPSLATVETPTLSTRRAEHTAADWGSLRFGTHALCLQAALAAKMEGLREAVMQQSVDFGSFFTTGSALETVARLFDRDQRAVQAGLGWPVGASRCAS